MQVHALTSPPPAGAPRSLELPRVAPPARTRDGAAQLGSPLAVDRVFREHAAYVWKSLRRLGVRSADLEDLTHDVFVVVHRKRGDYDPTRPLKPWLFGIAANCASDYRRKASFRREQLGGEHDWVDEGRAADEHLEAHQRRALVSAALAFVSEPRLAVFVMHELDGFAMPDITHALGIPLNTGYSRLRSARAEFAVAVGRLQREGRGAQGGAPVPRRAS